MKVEKKTFKFNHTMIVFVFLTVPPCALQSGGLEGSAGCEPFTLCCDGLDLQPVQTGRMQTRHHQNITVLKERREDMS